MCFRRCHKAFLFDEIEFEITNERFFSLKKFHSKMTNIENIDQIIDSIVSNFRDAVSRQAGATDSSPMSSSGAASTTTVAPEKDNSAVERSIIVVDLYTDADEQIRLLRERLPGESVVSDGRHLVLLATLAENLYAGRRLPIPIPIIAETFLSVVRSHCIALDPVNVDRSRCEGATSICDAFRRCLSGTELERDAVITSAKELVDLMQIIQPDALSNAGVALKLYNQFAPFFGHHFVSSITGSRFVAPRG